MKWFKYTLAVIILANWGCQPSLDLSPKGYQASSSYYKTASDAEAALTGAYSMLRNLYSNEVINATNLGGTDDAIPFLTGTADRIALWTYNIVPTNTYIGAIWTGSYTAIQYSNIILNRLPPINMDEGLKSQFVGEARFLRALHYFNLVRIYGDVPLVSAETTSLNDIMIPRSAKDEVYAFIEADLAAAEEVLPASYPQVSQGRATKWAAKALLAKVWLTRAGTSGSSPYWAKAASKAKEVIDSGQFDLWDNYADVFSLKNRSGKESVFEVLFVTDLAGNAFPTGYAPRGAPIVPNNGYGIVRVSEDLFKSYGTNDKRKHVTFLTSYTHPVSGQVVPLSATNPDPAVAISFWKLADETSKIVYQGGKSFPYMRYSDVLLVYAEALNESSGANNEAYLAINKVRGRAGLDPLSGLSKDAFRDAVLLERRLEFCFEANRWFDLVRTGRLVEVIKADHSFGRSAVIKPTHTVYPIPQREMDANSALKQNEGY